MNSDDAGRMRCRRKEMRKEIHLIARFFQEPSNQRSVPPMDQDPNKGSDKSGENTNKSADTIENDDKTGSGESVRDGEGTSNSRNRSIDAPSTDEGRPSASNGDAGSGNESINNRSDDNDVFTKPLPPPPPLLPAPVTGNSDDAYGHIGDSDRNDDSGKSDSDRAESENEGMSDNGSNSSSGSHKTKKSNRCQVCRKKVGLTGIFEFFNSDEFFAFVVL